MSNEQMAQSILQFTGGKGNIRIVSNCMTRVRLEVNDLSVVQIDQIKALKGVFGVHVDAQVQVIVGPGTAAKVAACLQELLGDAHKAAGQADKETAQEIDTESTERASNFSFSKCQIPVGELIEYCENPDITAEVVDDRNVRYNGEVMSLTALAKLLSGKKYSIAGPKFFKYKGEWLNDIRHRLGV